MSKKKWQLPIQGMTCAACVVRVERTLKKNDGVENVSVNLANGKAYFDLDDKVPLAAVAKSVAASGYELLLPREKESSGEEKNPMQEHEAALYKDLRTSMIFSIPVFMISMLMEFHFFHTVWPLPASETHRILLILSTPVVFLPGRRFYAIFWKNLLHKTADMNSLIAIGTGSAYGYSVLTTLFPDLLRVAGRAALHVYFDSTVVIITLVLLGRWLESRAKRKTTAAIQGLLALQPKTACVRRPDVEQWVPLADLQIGDIVIVRPGEKIAADGIIVTGEAGVDESMISGESLPIDKQVGDRVLAGSINRSGSVEFRITALGEQSVLGQIIKMVEQAQGSKAPIQQLADRVAGVFVPAVVVIALLTFMGWLAFTGYAGFANALLNFVAVLIVACPCALGLATPTAIMAATGWAARRGLFIKNGEGLELAHRVQVMLVDKTGTITQGRPQVQEIVVTDGMTESELLTLAASAENRSEHPLAQSVVARAHERGLPLLPSTSFKNHSGAGVEAMVDDRHVVVGNQGLLAAVKISLLTLPVRAQHCYDNGQTVLYISVDGAAKGFIALADPIKDNSAAALVQLQAMNIKVVMLTGDHPAAAAAIARQAGIREFVAEVMPDQKAEQVKKWQGQGYTVAMVGDGINDAPALAQADVGIAIGSGADVAIESASIILAKGDLSGVVNAITISRKTLRIIRQNLFWAFFYNVLGIPLAAFGLLNPMIAALAMSFSSVSVISNSLRLAARKA